MGDLIKGPTVKTWLHVLSNEWDKLVQGNDNVVLPTNTIKFIDPSKVPTGKQVTYVCFVCNLRPLKTEPWRFCLVVGGDRLNYVEDSGSSASTLMETKISINSTISDAKKGARFMSYDLKYFFLASPMKESEYTKISMKYFPPDIITK